MNHRTGDLTQGPVFRNLLLFSIPFVFSTLLQSVYSMVDMMVVGQFSGSSALSAVSISGNIIQLMTSLCVGAATGGQILIAQTAGAGKHSEIKEIVGMLAEMVIVTGILLSLASLCFSPQMLKAVEIPAEAFEQGKTYMYICGGGMVFTALYNMFSAIFRGMGDSRHPFIFIAIASVLNIILDYLFVAVFHMGVAGAAWATVTGQVVSVIFSAIFLAKHKEEFCISFDREVFRFNRSLFLRLFRLGLPLALQGSAISISALFVARLVNQLGVAPSATFGAGQKLQSIPSIITQAVGYGVSAMAAQNLGAKKYDRVQKTVTSALVITSCACLICGVIFFLYPVQTFSLFTTDPDVLELAPLFIKTLVISFPAMAMMSPFNNLINGAGDTGLSFAIAIADGFFARILLSWLLGNTFGLGILGYFLGNAFAPYITAVPGLIYFLTGRWKLKKLV